MKFDIFIISWAGKHDNAAHMAHSLSAFRDQLTIVYSDPDPNLSLKVGCRTIRRPNDQLFSDKFKACLDAATGDLLLLLHADCTCDDWAGLVRRCIDWHRTNPSIGIWAPLIIGNFWTLEKTRIAHISGTSLSIVAQPDSICFSLTKPIIERLRRADYSTNKFGWGIDYLMTSTALSKNLLVVVDESVIVRHPTSTAYDTRAASDAVQLFMTQFSVMEKILVKLLSAYMKQKHDQR